MAKSAKTVPQLYPRIDDDSRKEYGCLDDSTLVAHPGKLPSKKLKGLIRDAIRNANSKSSREILSIPADATENEVAEIYEREGKNLLMYIKTSCFDPPLFVQKLYQKSYTDVCLEQVKEYLSWKLRENDRFRNEALIKNGASSFLKVMPCTERHGLIYEVMSEFAQTERRFEDGGIPQDLLESFGNCCRHLGLVDETGHFVDPGRLLQFFCVEAGGIN